MVRGGTRETGERNQASIPCVLSLDFTLNDVCSHQEIWAGDFGNHFCLESHSGCSVGRLEATGREISVETVATTQVRDDSGLIHRSGEAVKTYWPW
jgi:hypothetical protein